MDIRGIEVTNQLRSAIRAKLLELGVRYDEELPDYILVMVVNKKTRQQMHEDLRLFLEESTTPFVEWLHDQVLKKLQKVTVAKKKTPREFVPTVVVKQEEERRKRKTSATSFLEDQACHGAEKSSEKNVKATKVPQKLEKSATKQTVPTLDTEETQADSPEKHPRKPSSPEKPARSWDSTENRSESTFNRESDVSSQSIESESSTVPRKTLIKIQSKASPTAKMTSSAESLSKLSIEAQISAKMSEISSRNSKKSSIVSDSSLPSLEKNEKPAESSSKNMDDDEEELSDDDEDDDNSKRLKSSINKPRITSVVSVKNRLGLASPRNKFEMQKNRLGFENRYRQPDRRFEKYQFEFSGRRNNFPRGRNFESDDRFRRNLSTGVDLEARNRDADKIIDMRNRLGSFRDEKPCKSVELREKAGSHSKMKTAEKVIVTIKDRLGTGSASSPREKQSMTRTKGIVEDQRNPKFPEKEKAVPGLNTNVKQRLGPLKNNFKAPGGKRRVNSSAKSSQSSEDEDCLNLGAEEDLDDDTQSVIDVGPVKSRIIAVNRNPPGRTERKRLKLTGKVDRTNKSSGNEDGEDPEEGKLASKVIVTPRPLKPLQPTQKRATQSLLLRAVAEANQSVVAKKNPEPVITDTTAAVKRLQAPGIREVGQNLSVRLNSSKRLVMEKIQVELTTEESDGEKNYLPQAVTEEQMGVVMSLFQRGDDNQKFLVTLNGYNNNVLKEKNTSDDEERLEMEVNEDDEYALANLHTNEYLKSEAALNSLQLTDIEEEVVPSGKHRAGENNENKNTENMEACEAVPRKRRKLSPIVYTRSRSSSPARPKNLLPLAPVSVKCQDKRPSIDTAPPVVIENSKEKCRYWPNCTLGIKCAFFHPAVLCSAFPACKFGDKCAYKHPKCKFGLQCTKLGCVFSHPAQQCKYHPFCTNPTCPYTHPPVLVKPPVEVVSQRAKFTWRKQD